MRRRHAGASEVSVINSLIDLFTVSGGCRRRGLVGHLAQLDLRGRSINFASYGVRVTRSHHPFFFLLPLPPLLLTVNRSQTFRRYLPFSSCVCSQTSCSGRHYISFRGFKFSECSRITSRISFERPRISSCLFRFQPTLPTA